MNISDINPAVRYAASANIKPINNFIRTTDARIFYILEANCKLHIENKVYDLTCDTLLCWKGGTTYRFATDIPLKMMVINFDIDQNGEDANIPIPPMLATENDCLDKPEKSLFDNSTFLTEPIILASAPEYKQPILEIINTFNGNEIYKKETASAQLKLFLTRLASVSQSIGSVSERLADKVLDYIEKNCEKELSNTDLGKIFGYHSHYINRIVLKKTGMTLHRHILEYRMEKARGLLINSSLSLSEISWICGFKNAAYFSNSFKKRMNVSPNAFRKNYANMI